MSIKLIDKLLLQQIKQFNYGRLYYKLLFALEFTADKLEGYDKRIINFFNDFYNNPVKTSRQLYKDLSNLKI